MPLSVAWLGVLIASPANAGDIYKADSATALNVAGSWTNNAVPGAADSAIWDSTVTVANTVNLGGNLTWKTLKILNPGGDVVINGTAGQTLTLSSESATNLDLTSATANLTFNTFTPTLFGVSSRGGTNLWAVTSGRTLTVNGPLGKSAANAKVTLKGGGNFVFNNIIPALGGAGGVLVDNAGGVVSLNASNAIGGVSAFPTGFGLTLSNGTLNLNHPYAIGLAAVPVNFNLFGGALDNTTGATLTQAAVNPINIGNDFAFLGTQDLNLGTGAATLGVGNGIAGGTTRTITVNSKTLTIGGVIANGTTADSLTKAGNGTLVLGGANTYTGATVVNAGKLVVSSASIGGGGYFVADGATLGVVRNAATTSLNVSSLTLGAISGATNSFTLPAGNPVAEVITAGTLTLNGINTLEILGSNFIAGQFPLIKYTTKTGSGSFAVNALGSVMARVTNNAANSSIDLVISNGVPAPTLALSVAPQTVSVTNVAQVVTLTWTAANLSSNCTYAITANQPVSFPGGGQTGGAVNGTNNVQALVNGTLGSTEFTLNISNAIPQWVASATATVTQTPVPSTNRPNILVILYDDTGWADFGCYGSPIQTPNIDSLAAGGLRFREFYNTARCSTTRCSILTGNYNQQVAAANGGSAPAPTLNLPDLRTDNNITIPELIGLNGPLGASGYRTYKAGKWHIGTIASRLPGARGFEHSFGNGANAAGKGVTDAVFGFWNESEFNLVSQNNEIPLRTYGPAKQFHYSDAIGDYCVDFINHCYATNHGDRPFFIYMPFNAPHFPVSAPAAMANRYTDVGDPNPGDTDIIRFEDGWDVIRPQIYQHQLATGVLKPGTALSPKGRTEQATVTSQPTPAQAPIDDWNTLNQAQRNDLARREAIYAAAVELNDQNIGKVINRLKELGQFDNTLIFVLCDNGANCEGGEFGVSSDSNYNNYWATTDLPAMSQPQSAYDALGIAYDKYPGNLRVGAAWANVDNTPYRLYKHYDHNGGIRTPLVVSWPAGMANSVKGTWTDQRGDIIDIMATIQDLTGAARPTTFNGHTVLPLQGVSLKPTFSGGSLPIRDLGFEHEKNRAYYRGNWKLVTKNFAFSDGSSPANELELYDMISDPTELTNRAASEPVVLARLVDAWNNWSMNVTLPTNTTYLLPAIVPPQSDPAPFGTDLFVDNFNRANTATVDASTNGMSGSRVLSMGANNTYAEGFEANGAGSISITNLGLRMSVGGGTSENGLKHNFIGPEITDAGGFSVQVRVDDINPFPPDSDCYAGFAVGLTQAEAAGGADIADAGSFRGNGVNRGVADAFIELDFYGHVKLWSNGVQLVSCPMGRNSGTLLASFATTNFSAGSSVTVTAFLDGEVVDLDPGSTNVTRTFTWQNHNANYIGLSTRITPQVAGFVKLDNLAIRTWPLAYSLASEYALNAGINAPTNAPASDPDADGSDNVVEWLHGGQPGVKDASRKLLLVGLTSQQEFRFNHFELVNPAAYGVSYNFECSSNLVNWSAFTPDIMSRQADVPGYELLERRVPTAIAAGNPSLFIRIIERISGAGLLPAAPLAPSVPLSQIQAASLPANED